MEFKDLTKIFASLEETSKRLEKIDILSTFFRDLKKNNKYIDFDKVIYLSQGQLISNIKQFPKIGLAEKMIIEALSTHSGLGPKRIKEILLKKGDIGSAAEIILKKKKQQQTLFRDTKSLTISEIYSELLKISQASGKGSQDIKLRSLRGILGKCSPLEAKFLLRIITSTLRMGVSTMTIIDALAEGLTDNKNNREEIERAFNIHPDLGEIAQILITQGLDALKKLKIIYGVPIRMMLASRLDYSEIMDKLGPKFIAEQKLDGERLQIHKKNNEIKLFSRQLLEITDRYPDVCEIIKSNIKANVAIFEGEVIAMDPFYEKMLPFQVLSKRRRKYDIDKMAKEIPVTVFLFDLLMCEGEEYINHSFLKRKKKLEEIIIKRDELQIVVSKEINNTDEMVEFFNESREIGCEGIINKSIKEDSFYQPGNRGFLWIKLKSLERGKMKDSVDVVLIGGYWGRGRRKGVYGTLLGAIYNPENNKFEALTRIASGFTDEIMDDILEKMKEYEIGKKPINVIAKEEPDIWFEPKVVIEIIGDEITISEKFDAGKSSESKTGFSIRFPVFLRFRDDKSPSQITTTQEIKNFYYEQ